MILENIKHISIDAINNNNTQIKVHCLLPGMSNSIFHTLRRSINQYIYNYKVVAIKIDGLKNPIINFENCLEQTIEVIKNIKNISFEIDLSKFTPNEITKYTINKKGEINASDFPFNIPLQKDQYIMTLTEEKEITLYTMCSAAYKSSKSIEKEFKEIEDNLIILDSVFNDNSILSYDIYNDEFGYEILSINVNKPIKIASQIIKNAFLINKNLFSELESAIDSQIIDINENLSLNDLKDSKLDIKDITFEHLTKNNVIAFKTMQKLSLLELVYLKDLQDVDVNYLTINPKNVLFLKKEIEVLKTLLKKFNMEFKIS